MKAIRVHTYGAADALQLDEVPTPTPGEGQALVKIDAAGLNFIDIYQRTGAYKIATPFILGQEAAGVVAEVGSGVTDLKPGDRVAYSSVMGSYADYAVVPANRLVAVPSGVTTQQAAAAMLQGMTAHYLTHSTYPLKPGDKALVHAAAGGVGQVLIQMAKQRGAWVVGTCSSVEKAKLAKEAGADEVINYTEQDFEEEVKRLTNGKGVDVVYDSVGKTTFDRSLNCLRPRGYMVLYGQASGAVPPLDPQILNQKGSLFLTRPSLNPHITTREELVERAGDVLGWIAAGKLDIRIDKTFPLAEVAEAHRYMEARRTMGKVLLIP